MEQDPAFGMIASYYTTGAQQLISRDRRKTFFVIDLLGDEQAKTEALRRLEPMLQVPGLTLRLGGLIPTNTAVFETIRADLTRAELYACGRRSGDPG